MSDNENRRGLSRRELLKRGAVGGAAIAGAGSLSGSALAAGSRSGKKEAVTLRVLTLGVEWPQGVQAQAEKDLGVKFQITAVGSVEQTQKAVTAPESFDIFGGYHQQTMQVFPTGNLQPVDISKVKAWNKIYPVFKQGKLNPASTTCTYGDGDAPFRVLYVDNAGKYKASNVSTAANLKAKNKIVAWTDEATGKPQGGLPEPKWTVGPPAHFNMDSMGYNSEVINLPANKVSWAQLLNPKWKGRVSILNDPTIGMIDAGNAASALGLMKFKHLGNMTKVEIDTLTKILEKYKKQGQFRAFWSTFNESVNLMASKEVVIESMWSPAVALLVTQGVPVKFAAPPEGFRGWASATGISAKVTDPAKLQACYDYINWTHGGFLGASIMRQGYYIANGSSLKSWIASPAGAKAGFSKEEYDFWYDGKPAARDLPGITGQPGDVKKGSVRDGGSFVKRACKYTAWNSFMVENEFQTTRWNDFLAA
jgi:putative spermidine/putrescine transport system substrate-binding protein